MAAFSRGGAGGKESVLGIGELTARLRTLEDDVDVLKKQLNCDHNGEMVFIDKCCPITYRPEYSVECKYCGKVLHRYMSREQWLCKKSEYLAQQAEEYGKQCEELRVKRTQTENEREV